MSDDIPRKPLPPEVLAEIQRIPSKPMGRRPAHSIAEDPDMPGPDFRWRDQLVADAKLESGAATDALVAMALTLRTQQEQLLYKLGKPGAYLTTDEQKALPSIANRLHEILGTLGVLTEKPKPRRSFLQ